MSSEIAYRNIKLLVDDINKHKTRDVTLEVAIEKGTLETCKSLIDGGFSIEPVSRFTGMGSLLIDAVRIDSLDKCKLLLDYGIDVNLVDNVGFSALMYATNKCNLEICKLLIDSGADVNLKCFRKQDAIGCAIYTASLEMYNFLLENGAEFRKEDKELLDIIIKNKKKHELAKQLKKTLKETAKQLENYYDTQI